MGEKNWNGRTFTSLCSLVSFILLCFTGIILYIQPHGRVAYWTKWRFWLLEKDQWGDIHVFSGLLFLIAGGFHVYYNWKPLTKYLTSKIENTLRYKSELLVSSVIFLWILVSGVWGLPPLVYVTDLAENIKNLWVTSPGLEPPFGHAELVSLKTFCLKQRIPLNQAMAELRKAGFEVASPKNTLAEIGDSKAVSGMKVYEVIKKLETNLEVDPGIVWTAEMVEEKFSGTGLGNKTLDQIIKNLALDRDRVYQRLKLNSIKIKGDENLKQLASKYNTTPLKLMTVILVE